MPDRINTRLGSERDFAAFVAWAHGRPVAFACGALLAPFIPYWFAGDTPDFLRVLYFSRLHWQDKSVNREFYDRASKLITIRKEHKYIVAPLDRPLRETNIANVTRYSGTDLQPYVMWDRNTAITVLASRNVSRTPTLVIPVDRFGMDAPRFGVTDLITSENTAHSRSEVLNGLAFSLSPGEVVPIGLSALSSPPAR